MSKPIEIALDNYNTDPELFKNLNKAHPNSYVRIREGSVWQNLKVIARFSNTEDAVNTLFEAGLETWRLVEVEIDGSFEEHSHCLAAF